MHDSGYNQRRMVAFAAIIALHVFIGWAFITGFGQSMVAKVQNILQTTIIKTDQVKEAPPPPPKVDFKPPPPPSMPVPLITVNIPIEAPPIVTTSRPPPPPAPKVVSTFQGTPVKTVQAPDCGEDYYPAQAKRLGQEGSAVVKLCVGINNKLDRPVEIVTGSGIPALDDAAGKCASAGRYKAGTGNDGKPYPSCKNIKITFKTTEAH